MPWAGLSICPSVCVCHTRESLINEHESRLISRLMMSKYSLHHMIEGCFSFFRPNFPIPNSEICPLMSALNRGTPLHDDGENWTNNRPYISRKRCKIWGKLLLLTHKKSHLMTSNDLNGIMAVILHYFTEIRIFWTNYVTVVKVGPILSATKM